MFGQLHQHARSHDSAESLELDADHVHPDPQRQQVIAPSLVGGVLDPDAAVDVLGDDARPWQRAALRVPHDA